MYLSMILAKSASGLLVGSKLGRCCSGLHCLASRCRVSSRPRQPQELPRFRAGTNLVRVDAYVSLQGQALTDLKVEDFQVFEDDKLQKIENFELVTARRAESAVGAHRSDQRARHASGRRRRHPCVHALPRSSCACRWPARIAPRSRSSILLDRMIGPDDLIGVMTSQISPSSVTYGRRTSSIERMITDNWIWGTRDRTAIAADAGGRGVVTPVMAPPRGPSSIAFARSRRSMPSRASSFTSMAFVPNESSC